jgi:hypothetical protein
MGGVVFQPPIESTRTILSAPGSTPFKDFHWQSEEYQSSLLFACQSLSLVESHTSVDCAINRANNIIKIHFLDLDISKPKTTMKLIQATTLFLAGSSASAKSIRKLQVPTTAAPMDMNATMPAMVTTGSATEPAFGGPTEPAGSTMPAMGTTGSATGPAVGETGPTTAGSVTTAAAGGSWLDNVTDAASDLAGNVTDGFNDWMDSLGGGDSNETSVNVTGVESTPAPESDDVVSFTPAPAPDSAAPALRFVSVAVIGAFVVSSIASL